MIKIMKTVKLWDKESKINGGVLQLEGWMTNSDVILIEDNGVVTNVENPNILKNILLNENKIWKMKKMYKILEND